MQRNTGEKETESSDASLVEWTVSVGIMPAAGTAVSRMVAFRSSSGIPSEPAVPSGVRHPSVLDRHCGCPARQGVRGKPSILFRVYKPVKTTANANNTNPYPSSSLAMRHSLRPYGTSQPQPIGEGLRHNDWK